MLVATALVVALGLIATLATTADEKTDGGTASKSTEPKISITPSSSVDTGMSSASQSPGGGAPVSEPLPNPGRFPVKPTLRPGSGSSNGDAGRNPRGSALPLPPMPPRGHIPIGGVLSRSDPVPPGIASQLEYFQGGGDVCGFGITTFSVAVKNRPDLDFMAAPDVLDVCVYGYAPEGEVTLEMRDPAGRIFESRQMNPGDLDAFNAVPFRRVRSDPMGLYTVAAIQNGITVSTAIEVRAASSPQFMGYVNDAYGLPDYGAFIVAKPGDTIRLAVGGYAPGSTVDMRIYHNPHQRQRDGKTVMDYLTSHPVTVDSNGAGMWVLQTERSGPSEQCFMFYSELVARRMYPAPDSPEAPSIIWNVQLCLFRDPLQSAGFK
ncbi:hypothetical protein [Micromonospora aurantiaca (nom. illeg.)]|uniref:hypothetical protein n=1 Tax=Micromonospora aurantiaca (nom. illeg.) TaxID=47850 RepID=UPI003652F720